MFVVHRSPITVEKRALPLCADVCQRSLPALFLRSSTHHGQIEQDSRSAYATDLLPITFFRLTVYVVQSVKPTAIVRQPVGKHGRR